MEEETDIYNFYNTNVYEKIAEKKKISREVE